MSRARSSCYVRFQAQDPATEVDGKRLTKRALELYKNRVSKGARRRVTIAVSEVDGLEVAVVYHPNQQTADRIAGRLRKMGAPQLAQAAPITPRWPSINASPRYK